MKPNMHPEMHTVKVHCQCGSEWETRSTKKELRVEICSVCHPFWTGKQKMMDTAGRVEKFNRKYGPKAVAVVETPVEGTEAAAETTTEN